MSRLTLGLVLVVGLLAGGLVVTLFDRAAPALTETEVRGIVSEALETGGPAAAPAMDAAAVAALVEDVLMNDPTILRRMSEKLAADERVAARTAQKQLLEAHRAAIYDAPGNVVLGNPQGDVTLVEMFDYNCGYCRQAVPDLATLIAEDPDLRVILKEFPILSQGSLEAARVAVLVADDEALDYWEFHRRLFSNRGQIGTEAALDVAEQIGGNRMELMVNMNGRLAGDAIEASYQLAQALNITGTPTYIIGDELIPGAIGLDVLRGKIANMRACGSTDCGGGAG